MHNDQCFNASMQALYVVWVSGRDQHVTHCVCEMQCVTHLGCTGFFKLDFFLSFYDFQFDYEQSYEH